MPSVPQSVIDQIRAANDIVEVVGAVVPLKRAGGNFVALCPFHREKTPSFNVNPSRQIFHCFGCHKGGDIFSFVREYEGLEFIEAVKRLAERARIPLELDSSGAAGAGRFLKDTLLRIHEQLCRHWQACLHAQPDGQIARDYLSQRGAPPETVQSFRLGYAPAGWDDTVNWARSKNYDLADLETGGLIVARDSGGYYSRFRGRLMFPICDDQGRVIGFSGRALRSEDMDRKYLNSPETPIFHKSRVFFGLDKSKRALLEAGFAIICEGQLDLMAAYHAGARNVVAPQGTAFTADHARILKRYVNEVVLCFDSDAAGQEAAVRVLDVLLEAGLAIRVARLPSSHDPDSLIRAEGPEAFHALIDQAESFFDYYLDRLCRTHDAQTDRGRNAIVVAMAEAVSKTGSPTTQDAYAQKTALRLGVTPEAARLEFSRLARRRRPAARAAESSSSEADEADPIAAPASLESWLLKLVFCDDVDLDWLRQRLDPRWIDHPTVRLILERVLNEAGQGTRLDAAALLDGAPQGARGLLTAAMAHEREIPNPDQQLRDLTPRLRNHAIDRQLAALMAQRTADPSLDDAKALELDLEMTRLRRLKRSELSLLESRKAASTDSEGA